MTLVSLENSDNYTDNRNIIEKAYHGFKDLQTYQIPFSSFLSCINYTKGHYDEIVYGKTLNEGVNWGFDWLKYPYYIEQAKEISNGNILNQRLHEAALTISLFAESTFAFLATFIETANLYLLKLSEEAIPGFLKIKKAVELTGKISAIVYSAYSATNSFELGKSLYLNKNERTALNYLKFLSEASLCLMTTAMLFQFITLTRTTSIIYNVSVVASFSFEHVSKKLQT